MLVGIDASRATAARRTGTEFYSLQLIRALLELDTAHRFRLYLNRPPETPRWLDGSRAARCQAVELRRIPFPRLWTHVRLGWEVARHPPDVLFVPSHVLPLWTRVPAVVTVHDLGYRFFPAAHPRCQRRYLDWSTAHSARTARAVIADSEATKDDLIACYGIPPPRIVVAYPGFDPGLAPERDPAVIAAVKGRYGIQDDYLLHIGTLQPRKNLARLVRAFARLELERPPQLVLAGAKGWLYERLFQEVERLGLQERVLLPGYVDDADKAALLSGASAYVLPSLYEGFGFPVLEAQACETPVLCADSASLPEVAGDGALYVDANDERDLAQGLARVLADEELRAELVARGRRNCRRFSWAACADTVLGVLEAAAGRGAT